MPRSQLPQVGFSVLLALSLRPRHGYEVMQQVAEDSGGRVSIGPGALYASIRQLDDEGLIEEIDAPDGEDARRRYYRLTADGREVLDAEVAHYARAVTLARRRRSVWRTEPDGV